MTGRREWLLAHGAWALGALGGCAQTEPATPATHNASQPFAAHLLNRLGFGPRPGDLEAVGRDPRAWVETQLEPASLVLPPRLTATLDEQPIVELDPIAVLREFYELQAQSLRAGNTPGSPPTAAEPAAALQRFVRRHVAPAQASRLRRALDSPRQLEEVMVDFWFNHFNVDQNKGIVRLLVGHYEHCAIRPHALGRFGDLLRATAHHPAMLFYLDNWNSVAERPGGRRGLNENYARELMELHTLGVDAGYAQADVTQLARMLTGWTFVSPRGSGPPAPSRLGPPARPEEMHGFRFDERVHDRGAKTWLGHRVEPRGKAEGDFALDVLARHPATARHIGFKLARYFVADEPPAALVDRLARVFADHDGRIVPVLRALFASDEFVAPAGFGAKFKTPYHYTLSALRASGLRPLEMQGVAVSLAQQGMPLHGCPTPDGFSHAQAAWLNPDAVSRRIHVAALLARGRLGGERLDGVPDPDALIATLGPLATPATRRAALARRSDPPLATALLLAGPGMMAR